MLIRPTSLTPQGIDLLEGEAGGLGVLGGLQPCEIKVSLTHTVRR